MQYNLFSLNDKWWTPYAFAGLGFFNFKSFANDPAGNKTYLQPLSTEGQEFITGKGNYKRTSLAIPFGIGAEYALNEDMRVGLEIGYRKTFTDYIDDVSTTYIDRTLFDKYLTPADAAIAKLISDKTIGIVTPGVTRYAPGVQRGNSNNNDAYFSFVLKFGIRFGSQFSNSYNKNAANRTRCPARF